MSKTPHKIHVSLADRSYEIVVGRGLLADAGKTMPFVDKAVYTREKEAIPLWNKFLQGYYDLSGIGSDNFD